MKRLANIHPGEILQEEFLQPLKISAYRLSQETKIPATRISEIIKKRRRISADTEHYASVNILVLRLNFGLGYKTITT